MAEDSLLQVPTPLGFTVRATRSYWELIVTHKHPVMRDRLAEVKLTLRGPCEIRRSRSDPTVHLFYRSDRPGRWTGVVAKRLDGEGFLVATYPADAIKEGERLWTK